MIDRKKPAQPGPNLALSAPKRAEKTANISADTAAKLKTAARVALGSQPAHVHTLSMASAKHLHAQGHISKAQHDQIQAVAKKGLAAAMGAKPGPAPQPTFGALAPHDEEGAW